MAILSEAQLRNAAGLEGPERLGLGSRPSLIKSRERSKSAKPYRDFLGNLSSDRLLGYVAGLGSGTLGTGAKGIGYGLDFLNFPNAGASMSDLGSEYYDDADSYLSKGLLGGLKNELGIASKDSDSSLPYNIVKPEDQPIDSLTKRNLKRPDSIFAEEGPLGSITEDAMAKIIARDDFDAKRDLIDEEANLKSFPATGGQIGEAQTDAESIEALGGGDPTEDLFSSAMQDYITGARGASPESPEEKTIEDYKKEFSDATGIDVSGKVDKSSALMAMGLALMQNKAGKGFNVGKILSEVGRAGEVALPKLEAAKKEAKLAAAKAGQFALESRSSDETKRLAAKEKAMDRSNYYIIPKSKGIEGTIDNLSEGSLQTLNKYELSKLMENPEFSAKFDVLPGSTWSGIVKEAMKTPEAKKKYLTTGRSINLIPGVKDEAFQIRIFDPDPNNNPNGKAIMPEDGSEQYRLLARMAKDQRDAEEKFIELKLLSSENRNVFTYGADKVNSLGAALGIKFSGNETESSRMIRILNNLAMKNASRILGESGKTISDGDRTRVDEIVGKLEAGTDIRTLDAKIDSLFQDIIVGGRRDIQQALGTLNKYTGRRIGDEAYNNKALDKEEQEKLNLYMKNFMIYDK